MVVKITIREALFFFFKYFKGEVRATIQFALPRSDEVLSPAPQMVTQAPPEMIPEGKCRSKPGTPLGEAQRQKK